MTHRFFLLLVSVKVSSVKTGDLDLSLLLAYCFLAATGRVFLLQLVDNFSSDFLYLLLQPTFFE
jgi:hypothetical protein